MRSTLLLPVDLLRFLARKVNALPLSTKVLLGALGGGGYYLKHHGASSTTGAGSLNHHHQQQQQAITDYVYFDLAADDRYLGRILIGLYGRLQPLTCENFVQMCKGYDVGGRRIGYRNSRITRVLPGKGIVMGDLFHPGSPLDSCTIYGRSMPEESFDAEFVQEGDVAMLSSNNDLGVSSRFLVTLAGNPYFGRKFVVVGTVVKGMRVIRSLRDEATVDSVPKRDLRVIGCGLYRGPEDGPKSYFVRDVAAAAAATTS